MKEPWFSHLANRWLDKNAQPDWQVLEFGSGWSTVWLASRCLMITSIEHDTEWYDEINNNTAYLNNVKLILTTRPYAEELWDNFGFYDLVIVDGRDRIKTAKKSYDLVIPGGYFIFDDAQRPRYSDAIDDIEEMNWEEVPGLGPGGRDDMSRLTRIWKTSE